MINDNICDRIIEFRIDTRVDYMPLSLTLEKELLWEENNAKEDRDEEEDRARKKKLLIVQNKEIIKNYNKNTEMINDEEDMVKDNRNNEVEAM